MGLAELFAATDTKPLRPVWLSRFRGAPIGDAVLRRCVLRKLHIDGWMPMASASRRIRAVDEDRRVGHPPEWPLGHD